ncbi:MAG: hypothetical protein KC736_04155 [Candidatus Moranbacteria bacterium]|nr:hypothetical protein [Candidatus Moranbacteria bacterium]
MFLWFFSALTLRATPNSRKDGEYEMTDHNSDHDDQFEEGGMKQWLQDNLRILISIIIVVALAAGIYSYSQRGNAPVVTDEAVNAGDEFALEDENGNDDALADIFANEDAPDEDMQQEDEAVQDNASTTDSQEAPEPVSDESANSDETTDTTEDAQQRDSDVTVSMSQETPDSFVESAQAGDGLTHLARRATANFLEKNPDSSLTPEHKVYIEDYLRKNSGNNSHVAVGSTVEFSKDMIAGAISASKQLSASQLENLKQYSARVSSFE